MHSDSGLAATLTTKGRLKLWFRRQNRGYLQFDQAERKQTTPIVKRLLVSVAQTLTLAAAPAMCRQTFSEDR